MSELLPVCDKFSKVGRVEFHKWEYLVVKDVRSCILRTFLDISSASYFISSGKVRFHSANLNYIQLKNRDKIQNSISIQFIYWFAKHVGIQHQMGDYVLWWKFFWKFLFWCMIWIPIFPCRLHRELLCFVKCFMAIQNDLFNQILWILWPCCDKFGEFILNLWENFSLNLIFLLWYLKNYIINPYFLFYYIRHHSA